MERSSKLYDGGMVHNPMIYDPIFLDFLANPIINDFLEQHFDPYCILYAFTTSSMPPGGTNFSNRIHVDCPRHIPNYPTNMGILVAIDEFTLENGAPYYLAGSHRSSEQPSEQEFLKNANRILLKPGEGLFFNARVWHMGGQNTTSKHRHALTINVCRSYMRQRFDYPRMLGDKILETANERLIRFLGYRVRVPVNLDEYYVPDEQRLYWSGQG